MEDILMLYYEINNIYLEMYKLELNKKIDDDFFLELIALLKEKIEEERELFENLFDGKDEDMYDYLYDLDQKVDTPFAKRISDYMRFYNDLEIKILDEDSDELRRNKIDTVNYAKLYVACTRNVFLIYLSFLQECIDDEEYSLLRNKILNFKYYNSFICHDVEYSNIMNNFSICRDNYINLHFVTKTLKLDSNEVNKVIFNCLYDTIITTIKQLLSITDMEYNNEDKMVISINNQCMLRAGLSIVSEKEYEKLKEDIVNTINDMSNDTNRISSDIINSIVVKRKNDMCRVKKISLSLTPLED